MCTSSCQPSPKFINKIMRVFMGLVCIFMATQMFQSGHAHFGQYFHAYRRMLLPGSHNRINESTTYDDYFQTAVAVQGFLMGLSGVLIMFGSRTYGPLLLIWQMIFLMALQDNPLVTEHIKPAPKNKSYKWADTTRHVSVIGAALLIMSAPVCEAEEPKKKKRE